MTRSECARVKTLQHHAGTRHAGLMSGLYESGYVLTISTAADWAPVNDALLGFEDGLVREVWLESGMWLTRDDQVAEEGMWRVVMLVQVQTAPIRSALLRFEGVSAAAFHQNKDVSPAEAADLANAGDGSNRWFVEFLLVPHRGGEVRSGAPRRPVGRSRTVPFRTWNRASRR